MPTDTLLEKLLSFQVFNSFENGIIFSYPLLSMEFFVLAIFRNRYLKRKKILLSNLILFTPQETEALGS